MSKKRRKFSSGFKAKVVLEALKERQTLQDLASKYELHSSQIVNWKKEFLANASEIFEAKTSSKKEEDGTEQLYNKIGHMQMQIDFLKKVLDK
jgi:transposase